MQNLENSDQLLTVVAFTIKYILYITISILTATEDGKGPQQHQKICLSTNVSGEEQEGQCREHLQTVYFYYETVSQCQLLLVQGQTLCKETGAYTEKMYRSVQKAPHGDNT